MPDIHSRFIALGGNRHPAAADWCRSPPSELVAFGAGRCVALWNPHDPKYRGIISSLKGHTNRVNVVRFLAGSDSIIVSGGADNNILIWNKDRGTQYAFGYGQIGSLEGHTGSINYIASVSLGSNSWLVTTASADGTIGVWKIALKEDGTAETTAIQSIKTLPKYMPLSFALTVPHPGREDSPEGPFILAVGGSFYNIDIFIAGADLQFKKGFTLPGHENWVRGLDFKRDHKNPEDVILASSAQDKFIRLWKFHHGKTETSIGSMAKDFSGKVYHMSIREGESETFYSCTNTGFLVGHEDWVFTIFWKPGPEMKLLSTSADNSMAIWEYDDDAEMWSITAQVGEVSTTKGASTATGSAGGLWLGMWGPDGNSLLAIGKTGSWRLWEYNAEEDRWMGKVAITGHIRQASGVTWCPDGSYLLSTSLDQTTRLFSRWKHNEEYYSWHEFARPQIHGYDLNVVGMIGEARFVSGADEKPLRVFKEPKPVAALLERLCDVYSNEKELMAEAASQGVLSLSNKEVNPDEMEDEDDDEQQDSAATVPIVSPLYTAPEPPIEDVLARHTLFPELEKLYGHGHEMASLAVSHNGKFIATACKASTIDHAVIRLFETGQWREIKPSLKAHNLTVLRFDFTQDDEYLLSVGRDRRWAVFKATGETYEKVSENPKGHLRVIWDGKWAPTEAGRIFVTSSRDKSFKVWSPMAGEDGTIKDWTASSVVKGTEPITSIDFFPRPVEVEGIKYIYLATGCESGAISLYRAPLETPTKFVLATHLDGALVPDMTVKQLSWNPKSEVGKAELAIASEDSSLRVLDISLL